MIPHFPDIIRCSPESYRYFYLKSANRDFVEYQWMGNGKNILAFNKDGTFLKKEGVDEFYRECEDMSIAELYTESRAYNIVTSNTKEGSENHSFVKNRPDAIICEHNDQKIVLYGEIIQNTIDDTFEEIKKNAMLSGWPDALRCGINHNRGYMFFLSDVQSDKITYQMLDCCTDYRVIYNIDKTHNRSMTHNDVQRGCINKTIEELIGEERAVFYNPTRTRSKFGSLNENTPDALRCAKEGMVFYLHEHGPTRSVYRPIKHKVT